MNRYQGFGNIFHWAPEAIEVGSEYGLETDVWSFGILLLFLLVEKKELEGWLAIDGTREFEDLIRKCLKVDPADWIKPEEIVIHEFF